MDNSEKQSSDNAEVWRQVREARALGETDPESSFSILRKLAEQGSYTAMADLGWNYEKGCGVKADFAMAEYWYCRAFDTGTEFYKKEVTRLLGWLYLETKQYKKAHDIFSIGCDMNYAPAIFYLGKMNRRGLGIKKDPAEARRLYERAAELGHVRANRDLAHLLMSGKCGMSNMFLGWRLLFKTMKAMYMYLDKEITSDLASDRAMFVKDLSPWPFLMKKQ